MKKCCCANRKTFAKSPEFLARLVAALIFTLGLMPLQAQDSDSDLAQELTNPLASIVTLPVSLQGGVGYWFESSAGAADDWRLRFQANFVFSK
jgi:hypothetical protein